VTTTPYCVGGDHGERRERSQEKQTIGTEGKRRQWITQRKAHGRNEWKAATCTCDDGECRPWGIKFADAGRRAQQAATGRHVSSSPPFLIGEHPYPFSGPVCRSPAPQSIMHTLRGTYPGGSDIYCSVLRSFLFASSLPQRRHPTVMGRNKTETKIREKKEGTQNKPKLV